MKISLLITALLLNLGCLAKITLIVQKAGGGLLGFGNVEQIIEPLANAGDCKVTLLCSEAGTNNCRTNNQAIFNAGCQVIVVNTHILDNWLGILEGDIGTLIQQGNLFGTLARGDMNITKPGTEYLNP